MTFMQDLGWFDGDPLNLHRESPKKQSQRMADFLAESQLMTKAREAMEAEDYIGAAQLVNTLSAFPENKGETPHG